MELCCWLCVLKHSAEGQRAPSQLVLLETFLLQGQPEPPNVPWASSGRGCTLPGEAQKPYHYTSLPCKVLFCLITSSHTFLKVIPIMSLFSKSGCEELDLEQVLFAKWLPSGYFRTLYSNTGVKHLNCHGAMHVSAWYDGNY